MLNKYRFAQDFEYPFRLGRVNIIRVLFVFLLFYSANYFSKQWQVKMDETIGQYQAVIRKEREDRFTATLPLIDQVRHLCKGESFLEEQYHPINEYIKEDLNKGIEKVYSVSFNNRIEEFENLFGKRYSKSASYDILSFYYNVLDQILEEFDNPFNLPSERNRTVIIKALTHLSTDSVKIHIVPIEFSHGPAKEIYIHKDTITVKSNYNNPIPVINPVTGQKSEIKFDKQFD